MLFLPKKKADKKEETNRSRMSRRLLILQQEKDAAKELIGKTIFEIVSVIKNHIRVPFICSFSFLLASRRMERTEIFAT